MAALLPRGRSALVEVQFTPEREDYDLNYVNAVVFVLGLADSNEQYRELVLRRLEADGFFFVSWHENVESFDPAINGWDDPITREAHERLSLDNPVQYVTFHCCHKSGLDS